MVVKQPPLDLNDTCVPACLPKCLKGTAWDTRGMVPPQRIGLVCLLPLATSGTGYADALHVWDCLCCPWYSSTCKQTSRKATQPDGRSMPTLQNHLILGNSQAPGEWGRVVNRHWCQMQRKWDTQEQMKERKTVIPRHQLFRACWVGCLMISKKLIQQRYKVNDRDLEIGKPEWNKAVLQLFQRNC